MTATPPRAPVALVAVGALILGACTASGEPDRLARTDDTVSTLPPVTTLAPPTTAPLPVPPTTGVFTTSGNSDSEDPADQTGAGEDDSEPEEPAGLERVQSILIPLLGPTADIGTAMNSMAPFPRSIPTPADASIVDLSIGAATPADDGTVLAQLAVTIRTSDTSNDVFDRMSSAAQASGAYPIDSSGEGTDRSAAFRVPGGDQFDELVITSRREAGGEGAIVRVVSTAALPTSAVTPYLDWADATLPLPRSDRLSTLVTASASGEGRLASRTITVESSAVVLDSSAQREANRVVQRLETSEAFTVDADFDGDAPLTGPVGFEPLDELFYEVAPTTVTLVDSEGELEDAEAVAVRLSGSVRVEG